MKKMINNLFSKTCIWLLVTLLVCPYSYASQVGKVTYIEGRVDIVRKDSDIATPLREQDEVYIGDVIRTKSNAKAEVTFKDESVVRMAQNSRIKVKDYQLHDDNRRKEATIDLHRGKVRAIIAKMKHDADFNVYTPNAEGTIKGSEIFAFYQAGNTGMLVSSGNLTVVNPQMPTIAPVVVTPGNSILVPQAGEPKGPRPYLDLEREFHEKDTSPPLTVSRRKNIRVIEGVVTKVSGDVAIRSKGDKEEHVAEVNEYVKTGDTIKTGEDGMIALKFDNGNTLNLKPNTHLVIRKLVIDPKTKEFDNLFEVSRGEIKAVVENIQGGSSFKVKTPHAISGVRGTIMYLIVTAAFTKSFFEGGPGFLESLISGTIKDVPMGESSYADANGFVSDPTPIEQDERQNIGEGWEPGTGIEGYSYPDGQNYNQQFDNDTNPQIIQQQQTTGEEGPNVIEQNPNEQNQNNNNGEGGGPTSPPITESPNSGSTGIDGNTDDTDDTDTGSETGDNNGQNGGGNTGGGGGNNGGEEPEFGDIQGALAGSFGSFNTANNTFVFDDQATMAGLLFIDGLPWLGPQPLTLNGQFSTVNAAQLWAALVVGSSEDNSMSFLGTASGINNTSLQGIFYGLYIRETGSGNVAGYLMSNDISGEFIGTETDGDFQGTGNVVAGIEVPTPFQNTDLFQLDPQTGEVILGDAIIETDLPEGGVFGNEISGQTDQSDAIRINGQNWELWSIAAGGTYAVVPATSWQAVIPQGTFFDDRISILRISGNGWDNGEFVGQVSGRSLDQSFLGTHSGDILGTYDQGTTTWQALAQGVTNYQPLIMSGISNVGGLVTLDQNGQVQLDGSSAGGKFGLLDLPFNNGAPFVFLGNTTGDFSGGGLLNLEFNGGSTPDTQIYGLMGLNIFGLPGFNSNRVNGLKTGIYIRPDGNGFVAGILATNLLVGQYDAFTLDLDGFFSSAPSLEASTIYNPANISGFADDAFDRRTVNTTIADGVFSGPAQFNFIKLDDQNAGIWSAYSVGGELQSVPNAPWQARSGGSLEGGYFISEFFGNAWSDNGFDALVTGRSLTPQSLGTIDGALLGTYDEAGQTWQALAQGIQTYQPLSFSGAMSGGLGPYSDFAGGSEFGSFNVLIGGTDSLFTPASEVYFLGNFQDSTGGLVGPENIGPLWTTPGFGGVQGQAVDGSSYIGYIGGYEKDAELNGLLNALYLRPSGNGYVTGILQSNNITGNLFHDFNVFEAQGNLTTFMESATNVTPADFTLGNAIQTRFLGPQEITGDITGNLLAIDGNAYSVAGQTWEIWSDAAAGNFATLPTDNWQAEFGSNEDGLTVTGQFTGQQWSNEEFRATVTGQVLTPTELGTIQGEFIGRYADDGTLGIGDAQWEGYLATYITYEPLVFAGGLEAQFGFASSGDFVPTTNTFMNGNLGGVDSVFGGDAVLTIQGDYNNPSNNTIWGSTFFSVSGDENGTQFLGHLIGTNVNTNLRGLFSSFYIRPNPNGAGNLAGLLRSTDVGGDFIPSTLMFEGEGNVTSLFDVPTGFTPDQLVVGQAVTVDDPIGATFFNVLLGPGSLTYRTSWIENQNWDIVQIFGGGDFIEAPTDSWSAQIGLNGVDGNEVWYAIHDFEGSPWENGEFTGTSSGRFMALDVETYEGAFIFDSANFLGTFDQSNNWQLVGTGFSAGDIAFLTGAMGTGNFGNYDTGVFDEDINTGNFQFILGSQENILNSVSGSPFSIIGDFNNPEWDVNNRFTALFSSGLAGITGATNDGGRVLGGIGGYFISPTHGAPLSALLNMLYIRPDGGGGFVAGLVTSLDIIGTVYSGLIDPANLSNGLFEAEGFAANLFESPTQYTPDQLSLDNESVVIEFPVGTGRIGNDDFFGSIELNTLQIEDQSWGILGGYLGGEVTGNIGETFEANFGGFQPDDNDFGIDAFWLGQVDGALDETGQLTGNATGQYLSIDSIGSIQGNILGLAGGAGSQWQGFFTGNFFEAAQLTSSGITNMNVSQFGNLPVNENIGLIGVLDPLWDDNQADFISAGSIDTFGFDPFITVDNGFFSFNFNEDLQFEQRFTTYPDAQGDYGSFVGIQQSASGPEDSLRTLIYGFYANPQNQVGIFSSAEGGVIFPDLNAFIIGGELQLQDPFSDIVDPGALNASIWWTDVGNGVGSPTGIFIDEESELFVDNIIGRSFSYNQEGVGVWNFNHHGTYTNPVSDEWQIANFVGMTQRNGSQVNPAAQSVGGAFIGNMLGTNFNKLPTDNNGILDAQFDGVWVGLLTGGRLSGRQMTGTTIGNYVEVDAGGGQWQAASVGEWVEVDELLDLNGFNTDELVELATTNVPITEVYTSLLTGDGSFQAGGAINANTAFIDFYTSDIAALNGIWAGNFAGDFSGATGSDWQVDLSGDFFGDDPLQNEPIGTIDALLTGTQWENGLWEATLSGSTSTGVNLEGVASGVFDDNNQWSGAGAGTWDQDLGSP